MGQLTSGALDLFCGSLALLLLLIRLDVPYRSALSKQNRRMMVVACVMLLSYGTAICFCRDTKMLHPALSFTAIVCFYVILALYTRYVSAVLAAEQIRSARIISAVNDCVCALGAVY